MTKAEIFEALETLEAEQRNLEQRRRELYQAAREALCPRQKGDLATANEYSSSAGKFFRIERIITEYTSRHYYESRHQATPDKTRALLTFTFISPVLKKDGQPHARHQERTFHFIREDR